MSSIMLKLIVLINVVCGIVLGRVTPEPYRDSFLDDVAPASGFFDAFRAGNSPVLYPDQRRSVTYDVLIAGWIYATSILAFSLLLMIPGVRRSHCGPLSAFIRTVFGVGIWLNIILCNFGQEWEIAHIESARTQYKSLLPGEVKANIGVYIGLRGINITLLGIPRVQALTSLSNETIDYNERFEWDNRGWTIGRSGFGPHAGEFNQEYRAAQQKGLPYPILWIAEYFTIDGEGQRWGRNYLQAGYFTHICVWMAWSIWCLALILYGMLPLYGACLSIVTGLVLLIANTIYATQRNINPLRIPFQFEGCTNASDVGDGRQCVMTFHYSWCFWLNLATGFTCIVIGIAVLALNNCKPDHLNEFFNFDFTDRSENTENDSAENNAENGTSTSKTAATADNAASSSVSNANDMQLNEIGSQERHIRQRTTEDLCSSQKTLEMAPRNPAMPSELFSDATASPTRDGYSVGEILVTSISDVNLTHSADIANGLRFNSGSSTSSCNMDDEILAGNGSEQDNDLVAYSDVTSEDSGACSGTIRL